MPLCYLSAYKYTRILWILQAKKHVFVKKVCSLPFCPKVCYNDTGLLGRKEERNLSILRTIALFVYLFGYMIVHYATLRRAERALAAGDLDTVEQIVKANIPRWSRGILRVTGARMTVEGQKNIPAGPCVFVGNHRSYYDIPILLTAIVESGRSFVIFPEGTRYKGEEGGAGEFKAGAFRIAIKTGVPVVPVAISGARGLFEGHGLRATPGDIRVRILPAIQTAGMSKAEQKQLPDAVRQTILAQL